MMNADLATGEVSPYGFFGMAGFTGGALPLTLGAAFL
jgi:hypothetical protein